MKLFFSVFGDFKLAKHDGSLESPGSFVIPWCSFPRPQFPAFRSLSPIPCPKSCPQFDVPVSLPPIPCPQFPIPVPQFPIPRPAPPPVPCPRLLPPIPCPSSLPPVPSSLSKVPCPQFAAPHGSLYLRRDWRFALSIARALGGFGLSLPSSYQGASTLCVGCLARFESGYAGSRLAIAGYHAQWGSHRDCCTHCALGYLGHCSCITATKYYQYELNAHAARDGSAARDDSVARDDSAARDGYSES